jgi:hypothetical protein
MNVKGKHKHSYHEMESLIDVGRFLIVYKPPKNYELVKVEIQEAEQLELELWDSVRGWDE